jgi:carbamoyl-phosphate synthase small subunit
MTTRNDARLVLEDGTILSGRSFGARGEFSGELVFNTSMTGYQEILTDPSYRGQIVMMTYPLIGNTGVNAEDDESDRAWLSGFVVRELSPVVSNFRAKGALGDWLAERGVPGIQGLDTRMLTRKIREQGAMTCLISTETTDPAELIRKVKAAPPLVGRDLVKEVTRGKRFVWTEGYARFQPPLGTGAGDRPTVVAIDYGAKANIFRSLVEVGFRVVVLPSDATGEQILAEKPDGVFLSNGPGDPEVLDAQVDAVKKVLGKLPLFGICLGHQLLGRALGGKTFKLKFGHHGGNQPVKDLQTGRVEITAQNHGFAVDPATLPPGRVVMTHVNLNDGTCEGIEAPDLRAFGVQYHPEAAPGPHDSLYLFKRFRALVDERLDRPASESAAGVATGGAR